MHIKPIIFAFLGFTIWTSSDAAIRMLNHFPFEMIALANGGLCTLFLLVLSPWLGGIKATLSMGQLGLRMLRGLALALSGVGAVVAFTELELATAYTLIFVAPFLAKILSSLVNKERISFHAWGITALGFTGVVVAMRPFELAESLSLNLGSIAALSCATLFALGYVLTRYIKKENQTLLSMAFFQYIMMAIFASIPAYFAFMRGDGGGVLIPSITPRDIGIASYMAIGNIAGTIIVSRAFAMAPAAVISPIHYVQIIGGTVFGALLFQEYPDGWAIGGAAIIVLAGGLLSVRQLRKAGVTA